ncbi:MAG: hypothetical protein GX594_02285 [Pirellulaceae bacterium]|nr:hypothetical protein [Pirellulaceae bacterium]
MHQLTIAEAGQDFAAIVDRVASEGISIEIRKGESVVAYLSPARPRSNLKVGDLNAFLENLPKLGDDAEEFSADLHEIHQECSA